MIQMADRSVFDIDKVNAGIAAVADILKDSGLNMLESWWVLYHLETSAAALLGEKYIALAKKWKEEGKLVPKEES